VFGLLVDDGKYLTSFATIEKEKTKESHMELLRQHHSSITLSSLPAPTT